MCCTCAHHRRLPVPPRSQDFNSLACLPHLPAWPNLRELRLSARHIVLEREHLPLLAAAPALKRLAFPRYADWADEAEQLMEVRWRG